MKKVFALLFASVMITGFIACGQSAEDKLKDSMQMDSVTKEADATADMLIEKMERENDSLARIDSANAANADTAAKK